MTQAHHPIPGSHRDPLPGARRVSDADPTATIQVTAILRRSPSTPGGPADPDDLDQVEQFAHENGLSVADVNPAARSIRLAGPCAAMSQAFGVNLGTYQTDDLQYRGREGSIHIPDHLAGIIVAVLGLDNRPQARAHFRVAGPAAGRRQFGAAHAMVAHAAGGGYAPQDVGARYGFPTTVTGAGQTVAVIELGGGYRTADLRTYFSELGLTKPKVSAVSVDGVHNAPGGDADGEVMLDIEVIGAVAQGARIVVYFAPNTTDGFYDAIAAALHDSHRSPSVISISWGQAEAGWTAAAMDAYDALLADAGSLGVTVYAAAGDDGAADNAAGRNVDFPASSPHAVGCGGTTLTDTDEVVWNGLANNHGATGGGVSTHFALPSYQNGVGVPAAPDGSVGRGVPDVAGDADPATGYLVRVDGQDVVIGGTSAVAPLWAGLTALANQANTTRAGAVHDRLYAHPEAFHDVTTGDNGGYSAGAGWDACTGLGSPHGSQIVTTLGS